MALFADFILDIFFMLFSTVLCRDWAIQKNIISNVADLRSLYIEKDTVANLKVSKSESRNRVESLFTKTPSHTTVQALSHTAVLALYFTNSQRRENKPIPLNQFKFSAL